MNEMPAEQQESLFWDFISLWLWNLVPFSRNAA